MCASEGIDLERLARLSRDLLAVSDADGRYLYVRGGWSRLLGYEPEELEGRRFIDFVHPDDVGATLAFVTESMAAGRAVQGFANRLVGKDGSVLHVRWFAELAADGLWYAAAEDVTSAVQTSAELEIQRDLMAKSEAMARTGSWRFDLKARTVTVSAEMFTIFGPAALRVPGDDSLGDPVQPEDRLLLDEACRAVVADGVQRSLTVRVTGPDGALRWVEMLVAREDDAAGDAVALLGVVQDVTQRHEVEAALRASEAKFAAAFRTSPDSVNINRLSDGLYLEINEGFTRILGYTPEDVAGKTSLELDIWADPADRERLVAGLRADGHVTNLEAGFRAKDGSIVRGLMSARVMVVDGEPCILSVTRDVSEIHAAQEALKVSEARYRELFTRMLEGLAICEMIYDEAGLPVDWVYLEVNDMFESLTGLKDVVDKRVSEIIPNVRETNPELFEIYGRAARSGERAMVEVDIPQLGLSLEVAVYGAGPDRFMAVFEDVSERRRARAEIEALNASLEQRVQERTEELAETNEELVCANERLAQTNQQLDEATRAKNDFLAGMSHELRTPLNSILGFSGTLIGGMAGPLSEEQRRQLTMINNSGRHLLELINRVLDLAKIEAGQEEVRLEVLDVVAVAEEMIETIRPLAQEKDLSIDVQVGAGAATVVADARRLRQILLNLLGNAVKFTEDGGISLVVSRDSAGIAFSVCDSGRGVTVEEREHIFDEFYQGAAPDGGKTAGTGLGLALSKRLAESMGGAILVDSRAGEGSCFTLRMP